MASVAFSLNAEWDASFGISAVWLLGHNAAGDVVGQTPHRCLSLPPLSLPHISSEGMCLLSVALRKGDSPGQADPISPLQI